MSYTHRAKQRKNTPNKQAKHTTFFDPMVYTLDRIKVHFDSRAHFTRDKQGNRVIAYALVTGKRIILGGLYTSNLVYNREIKHFTEQQAKAMCRDLGLW